MSALKLSRFNESNDSRRIALITRLNALEMEIDKIQRELSEEEHIQPSHVASGRAPIHKCPDEVLLHIFSRYLETPLGSHRSQHPYIRRLLLMCKRWNYVIMNTSSLWARIEIIDPYALFDYPNKKSLVSYIKACVQRSKELPLDVELDLSFLPNVNAYIAKAIYNCDERILSGANGCDFASAIEEADFEDCCSRQYNRQWNTASDSIFGDESGNTILGRYRMLKLTLPPDRFDYAGVLKGLRVPFPQLVSLKLMNTQDDELYAFTELPVVENLEFDYLSLGAFKVLPSRLKHLSMGMSSNFRVKDLSPFRLLQTLKMTFVYLFDMNEKAPVTVQLPDLHTLSLVGTYNPLRGLDFHLPSLNLLIIHTTNTQSRLPKLSPRRIIWYFDKLTSEYTIKQDIISLVRDVILLSPTTEHIAVSESVREEVMAVLLADDREARADSTPTHAVIGFKDGRSLIIDVVDKERLAGMTYIPLSPGSCMDI